MAQDNLCIDAVNGGDLRSSPRLSPVGRSIRVPRKATPSTNRPRSFAAPAVGMITLTSGGDGTAGCTSFRPGIELATTVPPAIRSRWSCWARALASCAHGLASMVSAVLCAHARQWYSGRGTWWTLSSDNRGNKRRAKSKSCAPSNCDRNPPTARTSRVRKHVKWHRYI